MRGLFGDMFDFDRNGELDAFERAMEYQFFEEMTNEEECDLRKEIELREKEYTKFTPLEGLCWYVFNRKERW